ncbi:MAG: hypothetical protein KKA10_17635 [Euryarchaeota archaeon]|nr:hypothetical protein [Euryarchaeota archaeon]
MYDEIEDVMIYRTASIIVGGKKPQAIAEILLSNEESKSLDYNRMNSFSSIYSPQRCGKTTILSQSVES